MTTDMTTPFAIELSLDDVSGFGHTSMASMHFREADHHGRFECHDKSVGAPEDEWNSIADRLLAAPVFDDGTLHWCESAVEALLLAKVHRAAGFTAHVLWDLAAEPGGPVPDGHVVLTSRPFGTP